MPARSLYRNSDGFDVKIRVVELTMPPTPGKTLESLLSQTSLGRFMQLDYFILDVFTNQRFTGNQLAVVMKADNLSDEQMQTIATEFNLSETAFVQQPLHERHTAALRIFTTRRELPFAGHPTIGAAVLLGLEQRATAVRLEEKVGLITAIMERVDSKNGSARFSLPQLPEEAGPPPSDEDVARSLGIDVSDVGCGDFRPAYYSAGVEYYLAPVKNAEVLANLKLERRGWHDIYKGGDHAVYVFTQTPEEPANDFAARMFEPSFGAGEDSATGSAAAALIGLIAKHSADADVQFQYKLRQGVEMGRPSLIELQGQLQDGVLVRGGIGGAAIVVAQGKLDVS